MIKSESKITARYAETDQMGIIHHSVYPVWYEVARTDFIKQFGYSYSQMEKDGIMLPLVSLNCVYLLPAKYEDELIIQTYVSELKYSSVTFSYEVLRVSDNKIISKGSTVHAFVNTSDFKVINIKKKNPNMYNYLKNAME